MQTRGERIRHLRLGLGLSQQVMSRIIGEGRAGTVSDWERGRKNPRTATVRAIAGLTDNPKIIYDWLCHGGGVPEIRAGEVW